MLESIQRKCSEASEGFGEQMLQEAAQGSGGIAIQVFKKCVDLELSDTV